MLGVVASSEVRSGAGSGKPAIVGDSLHQAWHPGATCFEKGNAQVWIAIGDALRNHPLEGKLNREPKRNRSLVVVCIIDVAQRAETVARVDCNWKTDVICRRPNRLQWGIVNSDITSHSEEHH